MSPELETLDQLLGGDLPLPVVLDLFPDAAHAARGLSGLLATGDVRLVTTDGAEVPGWRHGQVLAEPGVLPGCRVSLTPAGARRIG